MKMLFFRYQYDLELRKKLSFFKYFTFNKYFFKPKRMNKYILYISSFIIVIFIIYNYYYYHQFNMYMKYES